MIKKGYLSKKRRARGISPIQIIKKNSFEIIALTLLLLFIFTNSTSITTLAIYQFESYSSNLSITPVTEELSIPSEEEIILGNQTETPIIETPLKDFYEYTPENRTETLVQSQAVLDSPVTWTKIVSLPQETNNLEIEIHSKAFNIKIEEIINPTQLSITGSAIYQFDSYELISPIEETINKNLTIDPIKEENPIKEEITTTESNLTKTIIITKPIKNVKITYQSNTCSNI